MAEPHVVSALVKKRAELSGDIETTQAKLRQMILDLESLDKTLLMFDPEYRIECIRPKAFRPPESWSKRGEMTRIILGILRQRRLPADQVGRLAPCSGPTWWRRSEIRTLTKANPAALALSVVRQRGIRRGDRAVRHRLPNGRKAGREH
jgi:hypothetical protein